MKNIYFVQIENLLGDNDLYLPYASGCIAAYTFQDQIIRDNYHLGEFLFIRDTIENVAASIHEPYLVAFSCYVWNYEYQKVLAKKVKDMYPECLILFGGHHVYNNQSVQMETFPFVDFLIHGAGEVPFRDLLLQLLPGGDLSQVPFLSYRSVQGDIIRTQDAANCDHRSYPSPYLEGYFEDCFKKYTYSFAMTLETNRGCPYHCAFCDWGTVRQALVQTPMSRIEAEIDWAAEHKIEYIFCADANFGILPRDEHIVDYAVQKKMECGYPAMFNACFAKNSNEFVFRLNKKMNESGLSHGASISLQTVNPIALKNIGRENLTFERFHELLTLYHKANVPTFSEILLGIPGETVDSFSRGIGTLLEAGFHGSIEMYMCEILPNATMASATYQKEHAIETIQLRRLVWFSSPEEIDEIPEYACVICQTDTMSKSDWVAMNLYAIIVQGFHCLSITTLVAIYLFADKKIPYHQFYSDLYAFAKARPYSLLGELLPQYEARFSAFLTHEDDNILMYEKTFGNVMWPFYAMLFLQTAHQSARFFSELPTFLARYQIDSNIEQELIRWQSTMLTLPKKPPLQQSFQYDFNQFFSDFFAGNPQPLHKKRSELIFPQKTKEYIWSDFARDCVWYGRKSGKLMRKDFEVVYDAQ